ncbi:MAG TPA: transposase [Terriglobia bacterium]|nr:transposase [Terriglobia bacterium]
MEEYIAFDSHKHYTWVEREEASSGRVRQYRVEHAPGAIRGALAGCAPGTAVAVEATANWYWIVDEIEQAGLAPKLVHPRKAKLMMGMINKTDQMDTHGLNRLQRNGTLPTVWIPPGPLRELRELTRTRVALVAQRTRWKNRVTATLAKYGAAASEYSDPFGPRAREEMAARSERLPGVGVILSATLQLEIGEIARFPSAEHLAAYAGTTPRVHSSGDRTRYGRTRPDVNRHLKWALAEAANSVAVNHARCPDRHVSRLYRHLRERKGHSKAIGAVARHLGEAAFHLLDPV